MYRTKQRLRLLCVKSLLTLLAAAAGVSACCIPPNADVSFISRPSQKFLSGNSGMLEIKTISLAGVLAVAHSLIRIDKFFTFYCSFYTFFIFSNLICVYKVVTYMPGH